MMKHLKEGFPRFLQTNVPANPMKAEYFLPSVVDAQLSSGAATARVYTTPDKWYGVTYRQDREDVVNALSAMTKEGLYPMPMWP